ncbi:Isoleucine--tRNA ligase [Buchnera aphidicola (Anoecia corni)]|uniref:Isoleucine--tRNA ligase n=1 Tax=Buchnera aphidicola (Anoecia corni) TaxID=2994477 RepID=A0AAT9IGA2_9GAMM
MKNYKLTLNLPTTKFPMRANLLVKEREILKKWSLNKLYDLIRVKKKKKKKFILHDGPPYANGNIHLGHVLNKVLKDIIVKSKNMSGFNALYTPCWDCHGLPIEHKIEVIQRNKNKLNISKKDFRVLCREYALNQVENQKKDFIRLGVLSDWKKSYLTMDYKNEARIVRSVSKLIQNNFLYNGTRPIHWCIECQSSLAEAEVEYIEKESYSTFFVLLFYEEKKIKKIFKIKNEVSSIGIVIWTTTPWTLPSSQAIVIHPQFKYSLIEVNSCFFLVAKSLISNVLDNMKFKTYKEIGVVIGKSLINLSVFHPLKQSKTIPIIFGNHVKDDIGSGAVHTAPDHGEEDYLIGKKYNILPIFLINKYGCYYKDVPSEIIKKNVFESELIILGLLKKNKKLISFSLMKHSYPHCWRHRTPLIFYSTPQWFLNINKCDLREKSIELMNNVSCIPKWGRKHMKLMIKNRPDWCISRQRIWGVPISLFINKKTGEMHPRSVFFLKKISKRIEKEGIEAWWDLKKEEFLNKDECKIYKKSEDILDVWFDSGSISPSHIYHNHVNISNVSDVCIEGLDQYRGWFMSLLIISMATNGYIPYKNLISHGFVVDQKGYKMSKSTGNVIDPKKIINTVGADVLRLWVSSVNYSKDSILSQEIMQQMIEYYRKIRNTARFLLSNISDFNPKTDSIHIDEMILIDRWIISKTKKMQKKIIFCYEKFNFNKVLHYLMDFCSTDLGSFYLEIIKDRQYTSSTNSKIRRSCQTAMYLIIESFSRLISPILSFTADEIWSYIPGKKKNFIFTEEWFTGLVSFPKFSYISEKDWEIIVSVKNEVNKVIENARNIKLIKNSLESSLTMFVTGRLKEILHILGSETKFLFLTSECIVKDLKECKNDGFVSSNINNLKIKIKKFNGKKCSRCWHYVMVLSKDKQYPDICMRCLNNILGLDEKRMFI